MTTPATVYSRVPVCYFGSNIVIEYVDGYCDVQEEWLDEWRLIDLNSGEVFEKSPSPHDVIHAACSMVEKRLSSREREYTYVPERKPKPILVKFDDIPLKDKLRHIQSHAHDLEHDFKLEGKTDCPLAYALADYQMRYNEHPCFYKDEEGNWELYDF